MEDLLALKSTKSPDRRETVLWRRKPLTNESLKRGPRKIFDFWGALWARVKRRNGGRLKSPKRFLCDKPIPTIWLELLPISRLWIMPQAKSLEKKKNLPQSPVSSANADADAPSLVNATSRTNHTPKPNSHAELSSVLCLKLRTCV